MPALVSLSSRTSTVRAVHEPPRLSEQPEIYTLTLSRPEKRNALSPDLLSELKDALTTLGKLEKPVPVIITGTGAAFCAGADLKAMAAMTADQARIYTDGLRDLIFSLHDSPHIFIAAVNGFAVGGGCELMMNCDYSIVSDQASFGFPELQFGLMPGATGTAALASLVGPVRAKRMLLDGEFISADEALHIGLVSKVVPHDDLLVKAEAFAGTFDARSIAAASRMKSVVETALIRGTKEAYAAESEAFRECFRSGDTAQAISSYLTQKKRG